MLERYRATIRGNQIQWDGDAPAAASSQRGVDVYVTLAEPGSGAAGIVGQDAVAALDQIAARGGLSIAADPVEWQRIVRKDRGLPGRV